MNVIIFIFTIFCKTIFLHSSPSVANIQAVPSAVKVVGLHTNFANPPDQFNDLQQKVLLLNMCYPNFSITSLIPESAAIQSILSPDQWKRANLHLKLLEKIFHDYSPIRSTFSAMIFMLQNPHVMQKILNTTQDKDNGLSLSSSTTSVQNHTLKLLQLFESFVRSFNVGALLQSMADVPGKVSEKAMLHLEELCKILDTNSAYCTFIQGMILGLALQQSNPVLPQWRANENKQLPNSMRKL